MTKSVALYARVSSERQVQQATIDSQVAALRARATQDGFIVLPSDEYVDNGHSGSSLRRPALERLRDRVAQGAVDTLYVHSPDRLARRHAHQVLLLEELASRGVRVTMLEGRNGDSAEDQLLVQVQGVIAEYERAKIMERSRRGKLHKARIGSVNVLSNAPYGCVCSVEHIGLGRRPDGRFEYHFHRPDPTGRTSWVTDEPSWCRRLATLIPPRRRHTSRFHGVLSSAHRWRGHGNSARAVTGCGRRCSHVLRPVGPYDGRRVEPV